jgi:hypothetical protein
MRPFVCEIARPIGMTVEIVSMTGDDPFASVSANLYAHHAGAELIDQAVVRRQFLVQSVVKVVRQLLSILSGNPFEGGFAAHPDRDRVQMILSYFAKFTFAFL